MAQLPVITNATTVTPSAGNIRYAAGDQPGAIVGGAVQQLGATVSRVGFEILDREKKARQELDMTAALGSSVDALGALDVEISKLPPRERLAHLEKRQAEIRTSALSGLDAETARKFDRRFEVLSKSRAAAAKMEIRRAEVQDHRETLERTNDKLMTTAFLARSSTERDAAIAMIKDGYARAVETGVYTPAQAKALSRKSLGKYEEMTVRRMIAETPGAAIKILRDAKQLEHLDPIRREALTQEATNRLRALANAQKQKVAATADHITRSFLERGRTPPPDALVDLRRRADATGDKKLLAKVHALETSARFAVEFQALTLKQQADKLVSLERDVDSTTTAGGALTANSRYELAKKIHSQMKKAAEDSPNATAVRRDITRPTPLVLSGKLEVEDPANPSGKTTITPEVSIANRITAAEAAAKALGTPVKYLDRADRQDIAARFARASLDQKLELAGVLARGAGNKAAAIFKEIAPDDPTLATVGMLVSQGRTKAAREILTGHGYMAENKGAVTNRRDLEAAIRSRVADLFPAVGGTSIDATGGATNRIVAAAVATYVARSVNDGSIGSKGTLDGRDVDSGKLDSVIETLTGGTTKINGGRVALPPGVKADQATATWENVTVEAVTKAIGAAPVVNLGAGGKIAAPTDAQLRDMRLVSVGPGRYAVIYEAVGGQWASLRRGDTGEAVVFDWSKLRVKVKPSVDYLGLIGQRYGRPTLPGGSAK